MQNVKNLLSHYVEILRYFLEMFYIDMNPKGVNIFFAILAAIFYIYMAILVTGVMLLFLPIQIVVDLVMLFKKNKP